MADQPGRHREAVGLRSRVRVRQESATTHSDAPSFRIDRHLRQLTQVANSAPADNVVVLLSRGCGQFARSQTLTVGIGVIAGFLSMGTADVNGDHRPDLLVVEEFRGVQMLIGRGDKTFAAGPTLPAAVFEDVAVGDVNHDGVMAIALPATFQDR
jgi:FG-GAP-like repeat